MLFKTDSAGNVQWTRDLSFIVTMMILAKDGGFVTVGYTASESPMVSKIMLEKTDSEGNSQWVQIFDMGAFGTLNFLIQAQDTGFVFGGSIVLQPEAEKTGAWVIKTDSIGNLQWKRTYGDFYGASHMVQTSDGGFVFVGNTKGAGLVIRIDALGDIQLTKAYNHTSHNLMIKTSDGGYLLVDYEPMQDLSYVIKTDKELNIQWNRTYSELSYVSFALQDSFDDGYLFSGSYAPLVKTDSFGNVEWTKEYNGTLWSIIQTADGGYAFTGSIRDSDNSDITYILLVKIASESAAIRSHF